MSFPVPINEITALDTPKRESRHARNISSPYSLTIPPNKIKPWNTYPTGPTAESSIYSEYGSEASFAPTYPQKALVVSEKPLLPHDTDSHRSGSISSRTHQQADQQEDKKEQKKPWYRQKDRAVALGVVACLIVLLSIAIPLGILLPQKYVAPLPINILVPSTLAPKGRNWNQLTDSIVLHNELNFTIVINPDNGPGTNKTPSADYEKAIRGLGVHPNVQTLGWVDTEGGARDSMTVRADVERYSNWSSVQGLALNGIYFDHTPYRDEGNSSAYLKNITEAVRTAKGFLGTNFVVHNPGCVPDDRMMEARGDVTAVFEGAYWDAPTREVLKERLEGLGRTRDGFAMLVNSMPRDVGRVGLRRFIESVKREVQWLYVTDLEIITGAYGSLWEMWLDLVF